MPAVQVLLGGGFDKEGNPSIGDKVVKVPSKRISDAFRAILNDYDENSLDGEYFNNYYRRQVENEKLYFFTLLKEFTKIDEVPENYFLDWGSEEKYVKAVGVGECAGVILDLVGTLIQEAEEKFGNSVKAITNGSWEDSIYHSYNTFVVGAKALLVGEGAKTNTHISIINDFDEIFVQSGKVDLNGQSFVELVTKLNRVEPSEEFAQSFHNEAKTFVESLTELRKVQIKEQSETVS